MADMVKVSLLHPHALRLGGETYKYRRGIVEMPLEHAQAMGLTRRIVRAASGERETVVSRDPFGGVFDDKLTTILQAAGYTTLDALRSATQDDLLAIDGIGPANYERIRAATGG